MRLLFYYLGGGGTASRRGHLCDLSKVHSQLLWVFSIGSNAQLDRHTQILVNMPGPVCTR